MKAIVNTCDEYRVFTKHMILSYERYWPDHPFEFLIPYNEKPINGLKDRVNSPITGKKTLKPIRATMLTLLEEVGDEEWIFWMIDDKYLLELDYSFGDYLYPILEEIPVDGICFFKARRLANGEALSGETFLFKELRLLERIDYSQIWLHQFLKGKVLKYLFENMPRKMENPKVMDRLKYEIGLPDDFNLCVTHDNHGYLAESTSRGKVTRNCSRSLQQYGLEVPSNFQITEKIIRI